VPSAFRDASEMEFVEDTAEGRRGLREDVRRLEAAHEDTVERLMAAERDAAAVARHGVRNGATPAGSGHAPPAHSITDIYMF